MTESARACTIGEPGVDQFDQVIPVEATHETGIDLLVSLTNDERATAVTEVTQALKDKRGARPRVVYVIEITTTVPEAAVVTVTLLEALSNPRRRAAQEAEMRTVLRLDKGDRAGWPFSLEVGSVTSIIEEASRSSAAQLVLMGLNRHGAISRAIGRDTARQVMSRVEIPVLAVTDTLRGLPKRVVVAVDFSRASMRAARLARRLVDDCGEMHLLYVAPTLPTGGVESAEGIQHIRDRGIETVFAELASELGDGSALRIRTNVLQGGNPATRILRYCEEVDADLIAIGSQRHHFLDRLLLGSTAAGVAGDGRWSVLVTPPMRAPKTGS